MLWREVDNLFSHDDLGLASSPSVEVSRPDVKGRNLPYLLCELPRDCVRRLSLVETCSGSRKGFRLKRDEEEVCCTAGLFGAGSMGCETVRRGKVRGRAGSGE